jgi:NADH pyrophosphatase NudC (nudix superfamily)
MNQCNNTSVGVVLKKGDSVYLIKRKNFPYGFACPAGHLDDGEGYEGGAVREIKEEVGIEISNLKLIFSETKKIPCKRGGSFHDWKIFQAEYSGNFKMQDLEVSDGGFYDREFIKQLMDKTETYLRKEISEEDWQKDPGMEVVWYEFFKELNL